MEQNMKEFYVVNFLKDGSIVDSVAGIEITREAFPEVYAILEKEREVEEIGQNEAV